MKNISEETMKDVKDTASQKLDKLKGQVEYLNMKMHLGVMEAQDEYEVQKKNLNNWITTAEEQLNKLEDASKEKTKAVRTSLDELRVQAALGKAETEDAFREQQKNMERKMNEIRQQASQLYNTSSEKAKVIASEIETQVDAYHTRFDLLRLRMKLGASDAGDLWESKKKELSSRLNEINNKLNEAKGDASERWSKMSGELSESWKHFKSAFTTKI
jgi:uncharacterized protein YjbJ (UPF0337 family)